MLGELASMASNSHLLKIRQSENCCPYSSEKFPLLVFILGVAI